MVINPMIYFAAGLCELRPLLRLPHQGVAKHGIVQALQFTSNIARELESLDLGTGESGFKLLDTMPRGKKPVNGAASHQEEGGNQNPETKAKREFHVHTSTPRHRRTIPQPALRLKTSHVPCRKQGQAPAVAAP